MAKDIKTYYEQSYIDNTLRLREVLKELPPFVRDYFRAIEPSTSSKTRISYAYDIRVFFHFLIENNPQLVAMKSCHGSETQNPACEGGPTSPLTRRGGR